MVIIRQQLSYNHEVDYQPQTITELMQKVSDTKNEIIAHALRDCLGLSVEQKDLDLISIVYDRFHYVFYEHIKLGYIRTIFNSHNIVIEFNSIPP